MAAPERISAGEFEALLLCAHRRSPPVDSFGAGSLAGLAETGEVRDTLTVNTVDPK